MPFAISRVPWSASVSLMIVLVTTAIAASGGGVARGDVAASLDLGSGSFTVITPNGDITGDYTGLASVSSSGRVTASLIMDVTGGTQDFEGATGSLAGDGTGAFVGEGSFSISFLGSISTTADPSAIRVHGKVSGTSSVSCSGGVISVALDGDGSFGKLGHVQAVLTHLLTNAAGCSP